MLNLGMKKQSLQVKDLLNQIPKAFLDRLGEETRVDYQVKKLTGERIFQLLLYGLIKQNNLSWRILETMLATVKYRQFSGLAVDFETDHSSLATRLSQIKSVYFEKIHEEVTKMLQETYPTEKVAGYRVVRFDSTLVSVAGTLLKIGGLRHGVNTRKKQASDPVDIKFSVGFDGWYGTKGKVFNEQAYLAEDTALPEIIHAHTLGKNEIAVFDRGINSRKTWENFSDQSLQFVTRAKAQFGKVKHELVRQITLVSDKNPVQTDTLSLNKDVEVYLYGQNGKKTKRTFRMIEAVRKDSGETLYFISNMFELEPEEIVFIYRRRWDIECFFKFLKQEFGFGHFLSRNKNGMEVMLYMTLIAFALIHIYYKANNIQGFKIAKIKFEQELEHELLKIIIEQCNGDPQLLDKLANKRF